MKQVLHDLDKLLLAHQDLWRPQPYKLDHPEWNLTYPMRRDALLSLSDAEVETLEADNTALVDYLTVFLPELGMLNTAVSFPRISEEQEPLNEARFGWEIPGRIACTGMVWGEKVTWAEL